MLIGIEKADYELGTSNTLLGSGCIVAGGRFDRPSFSETDQTYRLVVNHVVASRKIRGFHPGCGSNIALVEACRT
jgi:hypothetical protein